MNRLDARTAIEALRAGVPNRAAVRLMGTEETGIEQAFDALLSSVWETPAGHGMGIAGGFGTGKSHFLGYLAEVARTQGFVVSRVVVSKETPLADPGRVLEAALRDTVLPGRNDDPIGAALAMLRESSDRLETLEAEVSAPEAGLAGVFAAILYLLRRAAISPELVRRLERFLSGGKFSAPVVRQALSAVGASRRFDLKLPSAAALAEMRVRFASLLFRAAGFAGWCVLLDEVELIGRYTPLQRASAYAWLAVWLGLEGGDRRRFPGIATVYAITDDFVAAVVEAREDASRLPERLRLKGRAEDSDLALAAIGHIGETVRAHRLRPPGEEELQRSCSRLGEIYTAAHDWPAPALPAEVRTASRTMRQYIKGWVTQWDLLRLTGGQARIVEEALRANYEEAAGLGEAPAEDGGDEWG